MRWLYEPHCTRSPQIDLGGVQAIILGIVRGVTVCEVGVLSLWILHRGVLMERYTTHVNGKSHE